MSSPEGSLLTSGPNDNTARCGSTGKERNWSCTEASSSGPLCARKPCMWWPCSQASSRWMRAINSSDGFGPLTGPSAKMRACASGCSCRNTRSAPESMLNWRQNHEVRSSPAIGGIGMGSPGGIAIPGGGIPPCGIPPGGGHGGAPAMSRLGTGSPQPLPTCTFSPQALPTTGGPVGTSAMHGGGAAGAGAASGTKAMDVGGCCCCGCCGCCGWCGC